MQKDIIYLGDCLEGMKALPDKCCDVAFTSPPYNDTGGDNVDVANVEGASNTHKKYLTTEGHKDDWFEWMVNCIDEMLRVCKKYVLINIQALSKNRVNVYSLIGHYSKQIHDILIWEKPNGCPTSTPNKISNKYEFVLILKCKGVKGVSVNSRYYTNVLTFNINANKEFGKIHRAVMNKDFCDEIIKEFTTPGDLVLDPFGGMATTAVSCIEQGRHFLLYEIDETYKREAEKRLARTYANLDPESISDEDVETISYYLNLLEGE